MRLPRPLGPKGSGTEQADPAADLGAEASRIADAVAVHQADPGGDVHQQCRADADQNVGAQAGGFARELSLEADDPAEEHGERQLDEEVDAQGAGELE